MDELEACRLWISRDFSMIPAALIERAYAPDFEDIEIVAPTTDAIAKEFIAKGECDGNCDYCVDYSCEEYYYHAAPRIPMWGWVFVPDVPIEQWWIKNNAQEIYEKCGIIVYYTDEIGVYLGINGAGYDFYEAHWLPLYRLRGLKWHSQEADNGR